MTHTVPETSLSQRLPLLVLPLVALIAILPLLVNGCSCGHDFDFHILSWMEAATQFLHGSLHPHWAFTPAFNAGEPRFVFYPPISWSIGAVLGLLMPWSITPIAYTWLSLTAAGLALHYLVRDFAPPSIALLLATLYIVNPYILFTAYERTAYAELLAAAWLPLLLHAVLRDKVTIPRIAIPIALLWLTNAPAAVMGCYALALLAALRLVMTPRNADPSRTAPLQLALNSVAGTALGLGLAAFYILPAAYERRYVQIAMAIVEGMRIEDNFLFHHTPDPDHDGVLRTASLIAVGLLLFTATALLTAIVRARRAPRNYKLLQTLYALAALTAVIAFLQMPLSIALWHHAPELRFLQFPWRFLAVLVPVLAFTISIILKRPLRNRWLYPGLVLSASLTFIWYPIFRQSCDPEDTVAARLALYHSPTGTDPTDEYTPNTADNDALGKTNPPYWLADSPDDPPPANLPAGSLHWPLDIASPEPQTLILILNLRNYPAWRITLNHEQVAERLPRTDGLIAIPIPAGTSHLEVSYIRAPDETIGWGISIASLAVLGFTLRRHPSY